MTALLAVLAAASAGCAQNAFLELQVELPPAPDDGQTWYAFVQARPAIDAFEFGVDSQGADAPSVQLTDERQWTCLSVESADDDVDVRVTVRFCNTEDCTGFGDQDRQRWYYVEDPFYIGHRTYTDLVIDEIPECDLTNTCGWGTCDAGVCQCTADADCPGGATCHPAGNCVLRVLRCDVVGCLGGPTSSYCSMNGEHFCADDNAQDIESAMANRCGGP
jgi:hypothetical protein